MEIELKWFEENPSDNDDEEDEIEIIEKFPAKHIVCDECSGHGYVLCEGMRGYAYTAEEFNESFDDDESREEYFKVGGMYDQSCPTCKGKNVVKVVDEERLSKEQKETYARYEKWADEEESYRSMDRAERDAERRFGC